MLRFHLQALPRPLFLLPGQSLVPFCACTAPGRAVSVSSAARALRFCCVAQCEHLHLDWIRLLFRQLSRSGTASFTLTVSVCVDFSAFFLPLTDASQRNQNWRQQCADIDGDGRNPWQKLLFVLRFSFDSLLSLSLPLFRCLQFLIKCIIRIYYSNVLLIYAKPALALSRSLVLIRSSPKKYATFFLYLASDASAFLN